MPHGTLPDASRDAALARAESVEKERPAARSATELAGARHADDEALTAACEQATREIASVQAACQAQIDAARSLADAARLLP
jgi:hypothetical protein